MEDTIVAPATPGGRGGVSVIRISGPCASSVGGRLCGKLPLPWRLKSCSICGEGGGPIDSGLVVYFAKPKSYTGEDVVEIHCHGNPLIVDSVVSAAILFGARLAEPGEFTKRAFLNNKIDLAQAESVSDLIAAQTLSAVRGAGSSLSGEFSETILGSIKRITELRVLVEAGLDFPDEEGVRPVPTSGGPCMKEIEEELSFLDDLLSNSRAGLRLREGAKVVLVGPPNSGKSTLLNAFAKKDIAIVSSSPGTTRDAVRADIDLGGVPVEVVDTAGIRALGAGPVEAEGMQRAAVEVEGADLVLLISEVGLEFEAPFVKEVPVLRVFNKSDLYAKKSLVGPEGVIFISALCGEGLDHLLEKMCSVVGLGVGVEVPMLARRRHLSFLVLAKESLDRALKISSSLGGLELVAEELRGAQAALGEITNPISSDDLLGEIFSSFCIGK